MGRFLPPLNHVVFASLLHLLLPLLCRRLPYSFYFDRSLCGEASDGRAEEEAAFKQLANIASRNRELSKNVSREDEQLQLAQHEHSQLAVLVLTARRQGGVSYLGRSLLALHKEALAATHPPLVFVCTGEEAFQVKELPFPFLKPNISLPNPKDVNQKALCVLRSSLGDSDMEQQFCETHPDPGRRGRGASSPESQKAKTFRIARFLSQKLSG